MKVRWSSRSLRLRITPTELERLQQNIAVQEHLTIPGSPEGSGWEIVLRVMNIARSDLRSEGSVLHFDLCHSDLATLARADSEGVYCQRHDRGDFAFYVEKDFPCIHPRPTEAREADTETFAPPEGFAERKA